MFEVLEQVFWWALLIVSAPSLMIALGSMVFFVEREKYREEMGKE